jgi:TRAP-type mannitol/chloroaromatic compound transport system substrate-binding protein
MPLTTIRRSVLSLLAICLLLAASAPPAQAKTVWRAQSSYPAGLPQLYTPAERFAELVEKLTDGELVITMQPGGAIVPSKQVFSAVDNGVLDLGCTWAGWWMGKFPSAALFANSRPNGMQLREMLAWLFHGGGLKLWNALYADHNLVVLPPYGMLGSENFCWSREPIESLEDFQGLKFRTVGIWGRILEDLGARVVQLPGGEVYPSLERGVIDAAEFATPGIDRELGFEEICSYLLVPGIHEPCTPLETLVNEDSWNSLSPEIQTEVRLAAKIACFEAVNRAMVQDAEAMNHFLDSDQIAVSRITPAMIERIKELGRSKLDEMASEDEMFARVLESQRDFRRKVEPYAELIRLPYPYAEEGAGSGK